MSLLGTVMPSPKFVGLDADGAPLSGGKLYTYAAGTDTALSTYQDANLSVANANPVILDSAGRAVVFLTANTYKFTLTDASGNLMWTVDGVASTGLSQSIVGIGGIVHEFGGLEMSQVSATSYPSGTGYSTCHADTSWWTLDSALLNGSFALRGMMLTTTGGTFTVAIVNLSDGSPDTPIATISSTSTAGEVKTSTAIPFAAAGSNKTYAIKAQISTGLGFSWGLECVRVS